MEPQVRLVHWYDIDHRRIACGAPGLSNSTKHVRAVTCTACVALATATPLMAVAGADEYYPH